MKGLLFTYVLTYGGAIVSLFNPFYGLLIYICFAIIMPPALWHWSVPVGNYSRVIGIAFLLGWMIHGFGDRSLGKAKPVVMALLGYYLWVILSTIFAIDSERGIPFIEFLGKIILPFIAGITLITSWRQLEQLIWVILCSCAYLAYETNLAYLGGFSIERNGFRDLDNNTFSIMMATGFGLALVMGFEEPRAWRRYLCFGMAAALAHVPMLSFSRGGMLGVAVAGIVTAIVTPKNRRTWFMMGAAVCVGALLAGPSVVKEFNSSFEGSGPSGELDGSAESRIYLWKACTDVAVKHPIFGIGQECWGLVVSEYGFTKGKEAHSLWFQTAAELGIPGVAFLLLFYYRVVTHSWRARFEGDLPWMPMVARLTLVSLTGFAVAASFVTVDGLELPFYVALIGACGIKLAHIAANEESVAMAEEEFFEAEFESSRRRPRRPMLS